MIEIMLSKNLWMNGAEQLRGLVSSITVFFLSLYPRHTFLLIFESLDYVILKCATEVKSVKRNGKHITSS